MGDDNPPPEAYPRGVRSLRDSQTGERSRAKPPTMSDPEFAKTAKPAGPVQLTREQVSKAYDILEEQRFGPYMMKYGLVGSAGLVAATYVYGFFHLAQKNREAWMSSFRHRILIVGPVLAAYATANNILPMPFKEQLEGLLGRRAISLPDLITAKQVVKLSQDLPLSAQV
ncbi:hypothetical protein Agub_g11962 [Astrephomene gubernaculifera]|uniref:Uncharacterized protein n=1 Tax=Astrephomene gubernaculifera TaxID=47775 RepID=A0AAD3DXI4_9CHLO|nr:hypothetical protein Agub_g11962 [Astrephomene gubernaculifera]